QVAHRLLGAGRGGGQGEGDEQQPPFRVHDGLLVGRGRGAEVGAPDRPRMGCPRTRESHFSRRHAPPFQPSLPAPPDRNTRRRGKLLDPLVRDLALARALRDLDVVHCHTWYTHLAGCLVKQLTGAPLVLTTHSLEPHRPWKAEQLGTAYRASSWIERTAYQNADGVVAVSESMRQDVHDLYGVSQEKIRVVHNGIDLQQYKPTPDPAVLA